LTRQTLARAVEIFDRLRVRVGAAAAMEQAVEYAQAKPGPARLQIARNADAGACPDVVVASVLDAVARAYGVSIWRLRRGRRPMARLRDEIVYVTRKVAGPAASYPVLGGLLKRDHSSLIVGERKFEARLAADELLAARVERLIGAARAEAASAEKAVAA
jgi:chromosomal replication initiation ATPase DnaA